MIFADLCCLMTEETEKKEKIQPVLGLIRENNDVCCKQCEGERRIRRLVVRKASI